MVDESKVRLMTRLAIYEKNEKDKGLIRSKYFQGDYVRYNVLKTMVTSTIVYWGVVGYYAFMNFDNILAKVSDVDYFDVMYKLIGWYVAFCAVYFLIATLLYNYRYEKSKKGLIQYNSDLRDLIELEGGPMHHSRVIKGESRTVGSEIPFSDRTKAADSVRKKTDSGRRNTVSRSALVQQRQQEQDKLKSEQIKQNAARLAEQAEEKNRKEKQAAADREKIQERRKQLEREQLERIRREQQQMMRENHTYTSPDTAHTYTRSQGTVNSSTSSTSNITNANYEGRNN